MTECEKVICKMYLEDMHDNCNENRLLLQMLEAEPCEDAISRQAAIKAITNTSGIRGDALKALYDLPSVNPQDCDTCEVGNPCLYCKHEFEPQESEVDNG